MPNPEHLMTQTATLAHAADSVADEYNDDTLTYTTETVACLLHQTSRDERTAGGQIEDETLDLWLPAGTTVGPADRVTVDGYTYELHGVPIAAINRRTGTVSHIECTVRLTS